MSKDCVRVLLVEDSPSDARLLCEALQDYPLQRFAIQHAARLEEALTLLAPGPFDVILLDLNLPDSHGMETCQRVSRAAGQVPIIVLTGTDDEATAAEAMRLGVQDYLVKGFSQSSMIGRTIRYAVERGRARQALREANRQLQEQAEELAVQAEDLRTANEELREREQALSKAEERLHLAMEAGKVGVWEWQVGTERVEWSQGVYLLLGCPPGAVTPSREAFRQCIHPQDRARQEQALRESLELCQDYSCEFRVVWADGSVHWVEARGQYVYVGHGDSVALQMRGILADIDTRKLTEEALRQSEAHNRRLIENLKGNHFVYAHDTKGVFQYISESLTDVLGYSPGEFKAHYSTYMTDHPANQAVHRHTELSIQGIRQPPYEVQVWHKDGSSRWLEVQEVPVRDAQGQVIAVEGVAQDITERKRAEEALRELTATLESKVVQRTAQLKDRTRQLQKLTLDMSVAEDRERERIAHILHDDVQQELAAAKFHLSIVRSRIKDDSSLREIAAQVDEMLKSAIAKSRSLSHELHPAVLHGGDFAEALRWLANEMQAKHGLAVQVRAPGPVGAESDAIKTFLYKATQELLFNVIKHAQVRAAGIRVGRRRRYLCLAVSDRGRGFDPDRLQAAAGFGLLSIRERIELLGGRMKIRSAPGRGSTFFVVVPDAERLEDTGQTTEGGRKAEGGSPSSGRTLRVMLADDHEVVRQGLISLLREEDAVEIVGEATNGREAVDLADRLRPDVVIMDVSMPVMSGDEATRRIRSQLPQIRVIALSMWEESEVRERMYQAGAESYVLKTAPSEELLAAIRGPGDQAQEAAPPVTCA
jgi:PAS domain S-box-containing protein